MVVSDQPIPLGPSSVFFFFFAFLALGFVALRFCEPAFATRSLLAISFWHVSTSFQKIKNVFLALFSNHLGGGVLERRR